MVGMMLKSFEKAVGLAKGKGVIELVEARAELDNYIGKINDADVKSFTINALSDAPYQFWIDPCSGTGKYHPSEDQGVTGIVRHVIKAAEIAIELARPFCLDDEEKDYAASAAILHDIQKNGMPWGEWTDYRHGLMAAKWLERFELGRGKKKILGAIRYHMWKWTVAKNADEDTEKNVKRANAEELARALNASPLERVVQIADYMASRKGVSFMPGMEVVNHPLFIEKYGAGKEKSNPHSDLPKEGKKE